jgi:hypothetical protein
LRGGKGTVNGSRRAGWAIDVPEANFLDEFLMKSSGLLNAFVPIFSEAAVKLVPVWLTSAV